MNATVRELMESRPERLRAALPDIDTQTLRALTDALQDSVADIKSEIAAAAGKLRPPRDEGWLVRAGNARRYKARLLNLCLEEMGRRNREQRHGHRLADMFMAIAEEWMDPKEYQGILREAERVVDGSGNRAPAVVSIDPPADPVRIRRG